MNRKFITAFKGKRCQCYLCKHTKCAGDVTHLGVLGRSDPLYLCGHCANVAYDNGFEIWEMIF